MEQYKKKFKWFHNKKSHFELHNYESFIAPLNVDIFLTNVPYLNNCQNIDELSSNHLPVELTLQMDKISNQQVNKTVWSAYDKLSSKKRINRNVPTTTTIDTKIRDLCQLIHNSYRIATRP